VSWYSYTLVCEYLANIKGNKHVDFTDRGKANLVNTFILNSRHISFSLRHSFHILSGVKILNPYSTHAQELIQLVDLLLL
jgi:hypothetical protein